MRVLLDECLPRRLTQALPGHDVRTVADMRWAGRTNGELLRLAADQFDVFVTVDRNIQYQQNAPSLELGVVGATTSTTCYH
jgi:predicted nuclease of predicted toxin-antitoxin system